MAMADGSGGDPEMVGARSLAERRSPANHPALPDLLAGASGGFNPFSVAN